MKHTKRNIALIALFVGAMAVAIPAEDARAEKPISWLTVSVGYTMDTDYIWRGVSLSEYAGEGREKLNHTLSVGASIDLKELTGANIGTISLGGWWEWYADQPVLAGTGSDDHLQEIDWTVAWSMDLSEIEGVGDILTSVEIGWISYQFAGVVNSDADDTSEFYLKLGLNDSALWAALGAEGFSLSPYVAYYLDIDDVRGSWIEAGLSYEMALKDMGCEDMAVLKDTTVTPSVTFGVDHRYFGTSTRFATIVYRVDVAVDLNSALSIPEEYGSFSVGGYIAYNTVVNSGLKNSSATFTDTFYGGFAFGWEY